MPRHVVLLAVPDLTATFQCRAFQGKAFACLVAADAATVSAAAAGQFCVRLLNLGCVYFCAWGPGCERLHDIMDEEIVGPDPPDTERGEVTTTWHADETLAQALDYCFDCSGSDDAPILLIAVGSDEWASTMERQVAARLG